jgi:hypothetical protein
MHLVVGHNQRPAKASRTYLVRYVLLLNLLLDFGFFGASLLLFAVSSGTPGCAVLVQQACMQCAKFCLA